MSTVGSVEFDVGIDRSSITRAIQSVNTEFAKSGISINNLAFSPQALANLQAQINSQLSKLKVTLPSVPAPNIPPPSVPAPAPNIPPPSAPTPSGGGSESRQAAADRNAELRARIALTQSALAADSKSATELKKQSASIQEALRFKRQLAAIKNAGLAPEELKRAEAFARELTKLNQRKIRIGAEVDRASVSKTNDVLVGIFQGIGQQITQILTQAFAGGVQAITSFVGQSVQLNRQLQLTTNALSILQGGNDAAANSLQFLRDVSANTGQSLQALISNYTGTTAAAKEAGIAQSQVNELYEQTARVSAIFGRTQEETKLTFNALTQIISKGVVSMEELRQQLGEQLPVAFGATARGLGITTAELNELVASGQLTAAQFIPAFTQGLKEIEGGVAPASQAIGQLQNTVLSFQQSLGAALQPLEIGFAELAASLLSGLGSDPFAPISSAVQGVIDQIGKIPGVAETISKAFSDIASGAINTIAGIINNIGDALERNPGIIDSAVSSFTEMATIVGGVVNAVSSLIEPAIAFTRAIDATGEALRSSGLFALAAILDPIGTLADLFKGIQAAATGLGTAFSIVKNIAISTFDTIRDSIKTAIDSSPFAGAVQTIVGFFGEISLAWQGTFITITEGIDSIVRYFEPLGFELNRIKEILLSFQDFKPINPISTGLSAGQEGFKSIIQTITDSDIVATQQAEAEKSKLREDSLKRYENDSKKALSAISESESKAIQDVLRRQVSGAIDSDAAAAEIGKIEEAATAKRIKAKEKELETIRALEASGALKTEDAQKKIADVTAEKNKLIEDGLKSQIALQEEVAERAKKAAEEAKQAALEALDSQIARAQELNQIRQTELDIASQAIGRQQELLSVQGALASSAAELEKSRLDQTLKAAVAEQDITKARETAVKIAELNSRSIAVEFDIKRKQLALTQEQNRIDAQRQLAAAEIAAIEARINIEKARTAGASAEEVANLTRLAQLADEQVGAAKDNLANVDQINGLLQQQLDVEQQLTEQKNNQLDTVENLKKAEETLAKAQADFAKAQIDQAQRVADARRSAIQGLFGAISQEASKSAEEGVADLQRAADRLRTAQQSGLFRTAEGRAGAQSAETAIRDVGRLVQSGASDQQLIRFASGAENQDAVRQALEIAGRGDIAGLIEAETGFSQVEEVIREGNLALVEKLEEIRVALIERDVSSALAAGGGAQLTGDATAPSTPPQQTNIQSLTVSTPDPVSDTARVIKEFNEQMTRGQR